MKTAAEYDEAQRVYDREVRDAQDARDLAEDKALATIIGRNAEKELPAVKKDDFGFAVEREIKRDPIYDTILTVFPSTEEEGMLTMCTWRESGVEGMTKLTGAEALSLWEFLDGYLAGLNIASSR